MNDENRVLLWLMSGLVVLLFILGYLALPK